MQTETDKYECGGSKIIKQITVDSNEEATSEESSKFYETKNVEKKNKTMKCIRRILIQFVVSK